MDVEHKGTKYGTILEAVALLGADVPAVNTLSDLQTYMGAERELEFSSRVEFSTIRGTIDKEDINMNELEKALARIAELEATAKAQSEAITLSAKSDVEKDTQIAELKAADAKTKEDAAKVEFSRRAETVTSDLEALVKAKVITPAKRDELIKEFTADTAAMVEFTVKTFKDLAPADKKENGNVSNEGGDLKSEGGEPDEILHRKALNFSAEHRVPYRDAVNSVMDADPKLAREYLDQMEA